MSPSLSIWFAAACLSGVLITQTPSDDTKARLATALDKALMDHFGDAPDVELFEISCTADESGRVGEVTASLLGGNYTAITAFDAPTGAAAELSFVERGMAGRLAQFSITTDPVATLNSFSLKTATIVDIHVRMPLASPDTTETNCARIALLSDPLIALGSTSFIGNDRGPLESPRPPTEAASWWALAVAAALFVQGLMIGKIMRDVRSVAERSSVKELVQMRRTLRQLDLEM